MAIIRDDDGERIARIEEKIHQLQVQRDELRRLRDELDVGMPTPPATLQGATTRRATNRPTRRKAKKR
jgi:hypothetical protein